MPGKGNSWITLLFCLFASLLQGFLSVKGDKCLCSRDVTRRLDYMISWGLFQTKLSCDPTCIFKKSSWSPLENKLKFRICSGSSYFTFFCHQALGDERSIKVSHSRGPCWAVHYPGKWSFSFCEAQQHSTHFCFLHLSPLSLIVKLN